MGISISRRQWGWVSSVFLILLLAALPIIGIPRVWFLYIFLFFIYLAMANMWNLLAGYSGLISLAPAAFIGLAGYTLAVVTWVGWPYYIGIILGSFVAALFAIIISYPVFRLRGIYFAIGTMVVPEILRFVFLLWRPVGSVVYGKGAGYTVKGVAGIPPSLIYWYALAIGIASLFLLRYVLRSKLGLGLAAIRDNDATASSSGINVFNLKLYSFVISAFLTGMAGAIYYVYSGYIEPGSAFSIRWLITIMLATVIGGEGIEEGPIVGTIVVVFLYFLLARQAEISLIIQGVVLIGIMLLAPQGIMGLVRKTRIYQSLLNLSTPYEDEGTKNAIPNDLR